MDDSSFKEHFYELEERLGVYFRDKTLALQALTHKSIAEGQRRIEDYQRLEFLGDAVLQLAVSNMLFRLPTEMSEGDLTSFRSYLVNKEALIEMASSIGLSDYIRTGKGVPSNQPSVAADSLEALFGALFIDQSFAVTHCLIEGLVQKRLHRALSANKPPTNPKSSLQEQSLSLWNTLPNYVLMDHRVGNPDSFEVKVVLREGRVALGNGKTKKAAEQDAARNMLKQLSNNPDDD